jgi:SAM-dependent methyltransferase
MSENELKVGFQEHEVKDYEKKRYRGVDQRLVHSREMHIIERFLDRVALEAGGVLDVPCGYGRFSDLIRKRDLSLVSCDYSYYMVKRARESGEKRGFKDWGVVADAKRGLPFKRGAFDILLCMRFWHHIHIPAERKAILGFFSRVTSGWVILSYYQVNALHRFQRRFRQKLKTGTARIKMISKTEFYDEIQEAGFECVAAVPLFRGIHAQHVALLKKIGT